MSVSAARAPWPARKGGLWLRLYAHSLSIALFVLFALSFWLHLLGSTRRANEEASLHAAPAMTAVERLVDPEFWYESFQNWQSEFLSIGTLVVLGIFLRERGSPESSPFTLPTPRQEAKTRRRAEHRDPPGVRSSADVQRGAKSAAPARSKHGRARGVAVEHMDRRDQRGRVQRGRHDGEEGERRSFASRRNGTEVPRVRQASVDAAVGG